MARDLSSSIRTFASFTFVGNSPSGAGSVFTGTAVLIGVLEEALKESQFSGFAGSTNSFGTLSEYLSSLTPEQRHYLHQKLGPSLDEMIAVSKEVSPRRFAEGMLNIARGLEERDELGLALRMNASLVVAIHELPLQGIAQRAQQRIDAIQGTGAIAPHMGFLLKRVPQEALSPSGLLAMAAAGPVFKFTTAVAGGVLGNGVGAWIASNSLGFLVESGAFAFIGKGARSLGLGSHGPEDWSLEAIKHEWLAAMPMLIGLKISMGLTGKGIQKLAAAGYGKTALEAGAMLGIQQAGLYGGILAGNQISETTGYLPERSWAMAMTTGLTEYLHFSITGGLIGGGHRNSGELVNSSTGKLVNQSTSSPIHQFKNFLVSRSNPQLALEGSWIGAPLLSEMSKEPGAEILPFPISPRSKETPSPSPIYSEQILAQVKFQIAEAQNLIDQIHQLLPGIVLRGQVIVGHLDKGRGASPMVQQVIKNCLADLENLFRAITDAEASMEETSRHRFPLKRMGSTRNENGDPTYIELKSIRKKLNRALRYHQPLLGEVERVKAQLNELSDSPTAEIQARSKEALETPLKYLEERLSVMEDQRSFKVSLQRSFPYSKLSASRVQGMLAGVVAKEYFRYHPTKKVLLDLESPRGNDDEVIKKVFSKLNGIDPHGHHYDILTGSIRATKASYQELRNAWLGAYVPALVAVSGGNYSVFLQRLSSFNSFFDSETLEATRHVAQWLCEALQAEREPGEWLQAVPLPEVDSKGSLAVVRQVGKILLTSPADFEQALTLAIQSPAEMREDVLSLTGALLGAYHGRGILPLYFQERPATVSLMQHAMDYLHFHLKPALRMIRPESEKVKSPHFSQVQEALGERNKQVLHQVYYINVGLSRFLEAQSEGISARNLKNLILQTRLVTKIIGEVGSYLRRALQVNAEDFAKYPNLVEDYKAGDFLLSQYSLFLKKCLPILERYPFGISKGGVNAEHLEALTKIVSDLQELIPLVSENKISAAELSQKPYSSIDLLRLKAGASLAGEFIPLDEGALSVLQQSHQDSSSLPFNLHRLLDRFFETDGVDPRCLTSHKNLVALSPGYFYSEVLPAYLQIHANNPAIAYQELRSWNIDERIPDHDAFRGVAYLALRLLQGAKPDKNLLNDTAKFLGASPLAIRLRQLMVEKDLVGEDIASSLRSWNTRLDPLDSVILGIDAFYSHPHDMGKAVASLPPMPQDVHRTAQRIAGLLSGAHGGLAHFSIEGPSR